MELIEEGTLFWPKRPRQPTPTIAYLRNIRRREGPGEEGQSASRDAHPFPPPIQLRYGVDGKAKDQALLRPR